MCFHLSKEFPFLFHKLQEIYETKFILPYWEIVRFRMETRVHVAIKRLHYFESLLFDSANTYLTP